MTAILQKRILGLFPRICLSCAISQAMVERSLCGSPSAKPFNPLLMRNDAMSIQYRLFAVPENEIQNLLANPALAIGRLVLGGSHCCEVLNARQILALLLSGNPSRVDESGITLLAGGTELSVSELKGAPPRLLDFREVKLLNGALQRLTGVELQRRFQQQLVGATFFNPLGEPAFGWEEPACSGANGFEDDWTLDQADDFERIALEFESLKTFVAQTTGRREWLIVAMQDAE